MKELADAVVAGDVEKSELIAKKCVELKLNHLEVINKGIIEPLREIGDKFGRGEIFLSELIMSAEAAKAAMEVIVPEIRKGEKKVGYLGRVVIGTVAGDIHDIGKNIVAALLTAEGFEVIDLGVDVPTEKFIDKVRELKPDILGLSALLTTTMPVQREVIEALKKAGLRDSVKVMVGGAPVTAEWAQEIGADAYGADALDAVKKAKQLLGK
ncbi:cobalamin-binding protein [Candidatus Bathyarchaeota archaeon]|nr:MAG: cobalamin-binding protein [Candidatus Bathyarchaeota archaeon]